MDRNSIIGILLIIGIMIGYSIFMSPSAEELAQMKRSQDSITRIENARLEAIARDTAGQASQARIQEVAADTTPVAVTAADSTINTDSLQNVALAQQYGVFGPVAKGEEKHFTLENDELEVKISSKGGSIVYARLKNYRTYDSLPLILINEKLSKFNLNLFTRTNQQIGTSELYFSPVNGDVVNAGDSSSLIMRLQAGDNSSMDFVYSLGKEGFVLDFDIRFNNMDPVIATNVNDINLNWELKLAHQEKSLERERATSTVYFKYLDDEPDYISETSDEQISLEARTKWIAFKQQFFSSVLIADQAFEKYNAVIETKTPVDNDKIIKSTTANLAIPYDPAQSEFGMKFYLGPNHYSTMRKHDVMLERLIPLGWGIFGWVNRFLVIPVFNFLNSFNINFGIIILILTLLIKALLFPLTYKAYLSTAKMRVLKPEIDEIGKQFGKDKPMEKQQAVMALYKKAGVSPLGGCLPMLLQMPILIAMFNFFPSSIELRQESFLWAEDLSTYDSILDLPFNIPFYGDHVSLFTLLMTISTILYTRMNGQMSMNSEMKSMQWMMYLMPIMFLGVFNNYSAGLSYYYFLANMITFGQQFMMRKMVNDDALHKKIEEHRKKPKSHKKSAFQKRLEDAAKKKGYKLP